MIAEVIFYSLWGQPLFVCTVVGCETIKFPFFLCEPPTWLNFTEILAEAHYSYVWSTAQLWSKLYIEERFPVLFNASKSFMVWDLKMSNQEIHCRLQGYQLMGTMSKEIVCSPVSCFPSLILSFSTSHILWTDLQMLSWSPVSKWVTNMLHPAGPLLVSFALRRILEACAL